MSTPFFADLSNNNGSGALDAERYRAGGALLLGLKATEGTSFEDGDHHKWTHEAHINHIGVLHYHFARPDSSNPSSQAAFFLRYIHQYAGPFDWVALDYEVPKTGGGDAVWCSQFMRHISAASRFKCIGYSFTSLMNDRGLFHGDPTWEANFSSQADSRKNFARQFTDGRLGPLPHGMAGIAGACDVNRMSRKTQAHLVLNLKRNHQAK